MRAYIRAFVKNSSPVIPVLLSSAPATPKLPILLEDFHWVDFRLAEPDPLMQLVWGITGIKPQAPLATAQVIDTQTVAAQPVAPPTPEPEDNLSSEQGIDYTRLQDLLKAGKWRETDQETAGQMLEAMVKKYWWQVKRNDLANFPCADLITIDQLWVKYSKGKWGFSVQKEIYVGCGAKLDGEQPENDIWREFCRRVGWLKKGEKYLVNYEDLTFDLKNSTTGKLPFWRAVGCARLGVSSLASRLVNCSR